ncbi:MAG: hypothetical protein B7733_20550 [Myxococcales bacterium FL481]|nr:MAG: hypothetical protein B7733_20550 [Myxococcales bacterium FL481]
MPVKAQVPPLPPSPRPAPTNGRSDPYRNRIEQLHRHLTTQPDDTNALYELARVYLEYEHFEQAAPLFAKLLAEPERVDLDPAALAAVYSQAARASASAGDHDAAHHYRRQAHDLSPDDDQLLMELAESAFKLAAWDEAHRHYAILAARFEPRGDPRLEHVQRRVADIKRRQSGPTTAATANDSLHTALRVHTDNEHWPGVVRTLATLTEHEQDPATRSQYHRNAALVYRDKLRDPARALAEFEQALDDDPTHLESFEAIDQMLTEARQWSGLERSYRRMIARLQGRGMAQVELVLWRNLAEIYRTRLRNFDAATRAYEIVLARDADDHDARVQLVELYQRLLDQSFDRYAKSAVREHHALWQRQPNDTGSLHSLYRVYRRLGATDKSYCLAAALSLLHRATAEQADMYRRYRRPALVEAQGRVSEEFLDELVLHPDLDRKLTAVFAALAPAAMAVLAGRSDPATLDSVRTLDVQRDGSPLAETLRYISRTTGLALPQTLLRADIAHDLEIKLTRRDSQPQLSLAINTRTFRARPRIDMAFALARELFTLYPPFRVYELCDYDAQRLGDLLLAGLKLGGSRLERLPLRVHWLSRRLATHLDRPARRNLAALAQSFVDSHATADMRRWVRAVEASALRFGLVLCGDVGTAASVLAHERPRSPERKDKTWLVRELLSFSVSESFFVARERLGTRCLTPQPVTRLPAHPPRATGAASIATQRPSAPQRPAPQTNQINARLPTGLAERMKRRAARLLAERHGGPGNCTPQMAATIDAIVQEIDSWLGENNTPSNGRQQLGPRP